MICFYCRKWWVTPRGHTHNLSHTHTQQAWHLQHCNIVAAFVRKAWRYEDAIWMVSVWYLAWKELKPFFDFLIFFGCVGLWEMEQWLRQKPGLRTIEILFQNSRRGRTPAWKQLKACYEWSHMTKRDVLTYFGFKTLLLNNNHEIIDTFRYSKLAKLIYRPA